MNPKNSRKKSPIHENADANITCDFGDGDISRSRSFLSNTCTTGANGRRRHDDGTTEDGTTDSHVDFLNLIVDILGTMLTGHLYIYFYNNTYTTAVCEGCACVRACVGLVAACVVGVCI